MAKTPQSIAVGVIGTGGMGGRHALNLHTRVAGAHVAAVMDVDQLRMQTISEACGSAPMYQDARELIHAREVEAVLIASPDDTHAPLVLECLQLNKPVFCEKPLATRVADARQILEKESALGRRLVWVGFVRRYDPYHVALKQELAKGTIGRPILYRGWHRNMTVRPDHASTEFFLTGSAIHDFDTARWMLGQEIQEVIVRGVNTKPELGEHVFDLLTLQMVLTDRCLALVEVYVAARYGYEVGVEVVGKSGTLTIDVPCQPAIRSNQMHFSRIEPDWLERLAQGYIAELEAWIASLHTGNHTGPNTWDGLVSLQAVESAIQAVQTGQPASLPALDRPALYRIETNN